MCDVSAQNRTRYMGNVCIKVAGNSKTNHVTESWPQGSRGRYANELINMQNRYISSTKGSISIIFGHKNQGPKLCLCVQHMGSKVNKRS